MSNSLGNFSLIYNLCPKSNLSTGQKFSDLSTTNATYWFIYELQILSRALYKPKDFYYYLYIVRCEPCHFSVLEEMLDTLICNY